MLKRIEVPWLLDCEPRLVQQEALSRSYLGLKQQETHDAPIVPVRLNNGRPFKRWGHFLQMRLGKTPVCLNEWLLFEGCHGFNKIIIFSPNAYKYAWAAEAKRFGVPHNFHVYEASQYAHVRRAVAAEKLPYGLVVNYESVRSEETAAWLSSLINAKTMLVSDESIVIKDKDSLVTKAVLRLSTAAGVVRACTGKPIVQSPLDIYPQLKLLGNLVGVNFFQFRARYCKMGGFKNKEFKEAINMDSLGAIISQSAMYTKRSDWGTVSATDYMSLKSDMAPIQMQHYEDMRKELIILLESGEEIRATQVMVKFMKMQQIASGFVINEERKAIDLMDTKEIPKLKAVKELLSTQIDGKAIIVHHYKRSREVLAKELTKYNPAFISNDIWMNEQGKTLEGEKKKFNQDPKCRIIICQSKAAKYGHTLVGAEGDRCEFTIFYENTYSLDDRSQVEQRNQSVGQNWRSVVVDCIGSPIDARITEALQRKEDMSKTILDIARGLR